MLRKPPLGPERCSALGILADAPYGLPESSLLAHGFMSNLIDGLVRDGLATSTVETVWESRQRIEVARRGESPCRRPAS
jgi:hypothetical protein